MAIQSKKAKCNIMCREKYPSFAESFHRAGCNYKCVLGSGEGLGNGNGDVPPPKKEITQVIDQTQIQYQYELAQEVSVQAPFTYQPQISKTYAPTYQLWSPGAEAGARTEQTQRLDFNQILKTIQDIAQSQTAEQQQKAEQVATISEEERAAQGALGAIIVLAGLGAIGYFGYKEITKAKGKGQKAKGDKKNA